MATNELPCLKYADRLARDRVLVTLWVPSRVKQYWMAQAREIHGQGGKLSSLIGQAMDYYLTSRNQHKDISDIASNSFAQMQELEGKIMGKLKELETLNRKPVEPSISSEEEATTLKRKVLRLLHNMKATEEETPMWEALADSAKDFDIPEVTLEETCLFLLKDGKIAQNKRGRYYPK